jgi:uracil-DNA glycosylase family 4
MSKQFVRDEGALDAKLVIVGEAPGAWEEKAGRPFVGYSGNKLYEWWDHPSVQLRRIDAYITNVYPYRPPNNKISAIPKADLEHWTAQLYERLSALTNPVVIVPMGNTALEALTGKREITRYRGSILSYTMLGDCREVKVIPTIHPAAVFRQPQYDRICQLDWLRIAAELKSPELDLPRRTYEIDPTEADVRRMCRDADRAGMEGMLAIDIETPGGRIAVVGFSLTQDHAISIQLDGADDPRWEWVRRLCGLRVPKVLQNGHFDLFYLHFAGVTVRNWWWDTLAMHHCLDPMLPHSLDFMASVYTREPYWKQEAKDPDEIAKYASSVSALRGYNAKDAAVTRELGELFRHQLRVAGRLPFYRRHYRNLFRPLLSIMTHGIQVDREIRKAIYAEHVEAIGTIRRQLNDLAGFDLYGPKGALVPQRLAKFLYEVLGLPKQYNRKTKTRTKEGRLPTTTNEIALRKLQLRWPDRCGTAATKILDNRRHAKLAEFLRDQQIDGDGRMRCSMRFTTETGRLASRKNPWGTGGNMQNIDRETRHTFIPDQSGMVFLEVDESQAEDRIVKCLAGHPDLVDLARRTPDTFDVHRHNAAMLYGIREDQVDKVQRQVGKTARHAANYGMGPETLSEQLLKEGFVRTIDECRSLLDAAFIRPYDTILDWQRETRKQIIREHKLVNPFGRIYDVTHEPLSDGLYRRCYAFIPQSTVADILNQWGLIPLHRWLRASKLTSKINAQVHDSLLLSCPPAEVYPIMTFLQERMERPIHINGIDLTIPITYKVGRTWKGDHEWKRLPTKAEVKEVLSELV